MSFLAEFLGQAIIESITTPLGLRVLFHASLWAFPLIEFPFYNRRLKFAEIKKQIIPVQDSEHSLLNEGKYVYICGTAVGHDRIKDFECEQVSPPEGSISLIRTNHKYAAGSRTWDVTTDEILSSDVQIGMFQLANPLLQTLSKNYTKKTPLYGMPDHLELKKFWRLPFSSGDWFTLKSQRWYYRESNDGSETGPADGDIRIRYDYIPSGVVSLVAKQEGTVLKPIPPQEMLTSNIQPGAVSIENLADLNRQFFKWMRVAVLMVPAFCLPEVGIKSVRTVGLVALGTCVGVRCFFLMTTGKVLIPVGIGSDHLIQLGTDNRK